MHRLRHLLAAAFILTSFGCAKSASEAAAPSPPMEESYGGGGAMAGGEAAAPEMPYPTVASKADDYEDAAVRDAAPAATSLGAPAPPRGGVAGPTRPEPKPADTPTASSGQGEEKGKEPQKQFARQIIYTADMAISCFKLDDAMQRAEALTLESGGYVQTMSQGYFVLRIPAAQLRRVMEELGKLGVVESRNLQAQDVTQEYVDLTTRIRVLRETQSQLITLLKQARNVQEALEVRRSLDAITMELEQALGRLRLLENQIGFSTLTVRMSERGPQNAVPSSNDPFPWVDTLGVEATEWN
ncbi:DUF4349 domain-containing protein [Nannocystis sp. ILAH1]|uniref:DUF4349 domain-containing protein n=1 Tax=unclassified Nannocystis TaxID=2627009 RepID=UPI002271E1C2|nr:MULTISPECIES: DUF4349 domain-containing protein [unclassified Nannocystis]MCY0991367.1 DUF4349 domain-containing protein [Nannocystis sp. ILAH1]MCY1066416.1 DUF4349 domain-containing protein [Nannocystis sp. RBIL2]